MFQPSGMYTDSESMLGIIDEVLGTGGDGELGGDELKSGTTAKEGCAWDEYPLLSGCLSSIGLAFRVLLTKSYVTNPFNA